MSNEAWGTSSGFKSDYELLVTNSYWSPPTEKNPNWTLIWDGIDTDEDEETERVCMFGAGSDWASFDGGESVDHSAGNELKNGKPRQFHTNSGVGKLINTLIEQLDEDTLNTLDSPRNANVWIGSRWYMEEVDNSFTNRTTGEKVKNTKVLPVRLISWGSEGSVNASGADSFAPFDDDLIDQLQAIAQDISTHSEFMNKAIAIPGVATNDKLVIALSSEEFYQELRGEG